jgi:hypothetical protein
MNVNKKPWPLSTLFGLRKRIDTNPDFQRPAVWTTAQKQLLVDSILRGYDVPKLYWRRVPESKPDRYEVVDGQQRLRALWSYFSGEFALPRDAEPVGGAAIAGCSYDDLPDEVRTQLDVYPLDIVILDETDEDEVREMFLRLQNGTSLKAQEKRNAYPGKMRDFVRSLTQHALFQSVAFANSRYNHDLVAAQFVCLEIAGGPTNVKSADLNKMYSRYEEFDANGPTAKAVRRTMDMLVRIFPEKTPELERYNAISLYCVAAELQRQYAYQAIEPKLHDWFVAFEARRTQAELKEFVDESEPDPELATYKEKVSHSTDASESIRWRMDFLLRNLLETFPDLPRKDEQREFTHIQKLAIFRRDEGRCRLKFRCGGEKLAWDAWHCDHIQPWSKGGRSTVKNGQVACPECNLSKGNQSPAL